MKHIYKQLLAVLLLWPFMSASAQGWPANYDGVMLQGFYWDSYDDTKWTNLESQADELSQYFDLIWIPNSAKAQGGMGYTPVFWFTNYNSAFGNEQQLRSMINTYKAKGTGFIADVVINHRDGDNSAWNFPAENYNGKVYDMADGSIVSNDNIWSNMSTWGAGCPASYKGNRDTGDTFDGCRDLDHTNATVQEHCKAYTTFLINDLGYAGFRYDMVKGYGGQYTKIYNQASKPKFSVGEYFDDKYDAIAAWIEATGKTSAAFDFPCKYQINKAFKGNLSELVWMANGSNPQPAGLIHFGYPQYAVTFVDNHDTYRDGSKFEGNVLAANAFILSSPGTPCVFLPHYKENKAAIQAMIKARKQAGITNTSSVTVQRTDAGCYMAVVQGKKGKLGVKIGGAMVTPDGFNDSEIITSGNDYCIWVKNDGSGTGDIPGTDEPFTVYFDNSTSKWSTPYIHYWGNTESTWPGVAMSKVSDNVWSYTVPSGTTGLLFNAGDGDPTKTNDFVAQPNHIYNTTGDQGVYNGNGSDNPGNNGNPFNVYFDNSTSMWSTPYIHYWGNTESTWPGVAMSKVTDNVWSYTVPAGTTGLLFNAGDGDPTKTNDFVAQPNHIYNTTGDQGVYNGSGNDNPGGNTGKLYILGNIDGCQWSTSNSPELTANGKLFVGTFKLVPAEGETNCYFSFTSALGADWDQLNMAADRYGAATENAPAIIGMNSLVKYANNVDASGCQSYGIAPGTYTFTVDLENLNVTISGTVDKPGDDDDDPDFPDIPVSGKLYILGNIDGCQWSTSSSPELSVIGNQYKGTYKLVPAEGENTCYFSFTTALGADWDQLNMAADRYGAATNNAPAIVGKNSLVKYANNVDASGCLSFGIAPGTYTFTVDLNNLTCNISQDGNDGVESIAADEATPVYFNLQGVRVENPGNGIFIKVTGSKREKVYLK